MADWPRQVEGHVIDRQVLVGNATVEARYHCINCGMHVENLEEPRLERQLCGRKSP